MPRSKRNDTPPVVDKELAVPTGSNAGAPARAAAPRRGRRLVPAEPIRVIRPGLAQVAGLEVDTQVPWAEPENGRETPLVCECGALYVSSQQQVFTRRSVYHLHCPACGLAGAVPGELWAELRKHFEKIERVREAEPAGIFGTKAAPLPTTA